MKDIKMIDFENMVLENTKKIHNEYAPIVKDRNEKIIEINDLRGNIKKLLDNNEVLTTKLINLEA
jgi:predicted transcriptional regulator